MGGHEFWIDPVEAQIESGEAIVADIRVGQEFAGSAYSFFPRNFRRFDLSDSGGTAQVDGRMGDRPAVNQTADDGLVILVHETIDYDLTYREFEKFREFVEHKDAAWVLEAHADRGLPETEFGEAYSRYAKALIGVGSSEGQDRFFGLETEIVAGLNPYTDELQGGMPVTLFYQNEVRPDAQIEVFEKSSDGTVSISTVRTDLSGQALISVRPGYDYMLDAVVLREPSPEISEELGVVWESLWANLTFSVPNK